MYRSDADAARAAESEISKSGGDILTLQADVGDRTEALRILTGVAEQQGPSSETLGLIGRIHKDEWKEGKTEEQFLYSARKRAIGRFKQSWWDLDPAVLEKIGQDPVWGEV